MFSHEAVSKVKKEYQAEGQNVEVCQRTFSTSLEMTTRLGCQFEWNRELDALNKNCRLSTPLDMTIFKN